MTDDESSDVTIGVPTARSAESNSGEPDATETVVSVFVPVDDEWREFRLPAGEAMEVTVPTGDGAEVPAAQIAVDDGVTAADNEETDDTADVE